MTFPTALTDAQKNQMVELIGLAIVSINNPSVSADDKRQTAELIGLLASVAHNEIIYGTITTLIDRVGALETQLALLQRSTAEVN